MTETKVRFCDVCEKIVATQKMYKGKLEWYKTEHWQSEITDITICGECMKPLRAMLREIGTKPIREVCAYWEGAHYTEEKEEE